MNDSLYILQAAANDGNAPRSAVNPISLSINKNINPLKKIAYGINKKENPKNVIHSRMNLLKNACRCHADTCLCHADTCLCHADTCLCHADTCLCHADTCLCHADTCLCHDDTCLFTPFRRVQCAEQVIITSCWTNV